MNFPFITGEKIYLRGIQKEDLTNIAAWLNDPDVTRYMIMGEKPVHLEVLTEQWEKEIRSQNDATFAVIDKKKEKIVGWCGLYAIRWIPRVAEYRVFIGDKSYWNKGFATEVGQLLVQYGFEKLNLNKIYLGVNASYEAAVRCYEKTGFVKEGVLRDEIFRNNEYYDAVRMSILRKEYESKKKI